VVQIRHGISQKIVGTGFAVDEGIVSCAHVIRQAGVDPRIQDERDLIVYFPERGGRQGISLKAKVAACFPHHDDDVILLKIVDGQSPLGPGQIAKIGLARGSETHDFKSFGFRELQNYQGLYALGKIQGHVPRPRGSKLHGEPLMLSSQNIDRGMSGAPVLDIQRNLIVGVIYIAWDSAGFAHDRDTGFAVCSWVLSLEPLRLALQNDDLPKVPAPKPKIEIENARTQAAPLQIKALYNAPPSLKEWTGRNQLLQVITADWISSDVRIIGLIGFGGEGKSSLARRWVDNLLADKSLPQPESIFWWGFYENRNVDEFFETALKYLSGDKIDTRKIPSSNVRVQIIASMLGAGRYLFVLDGLEVLQYQEGDMYGSLLSSDLKDFLEFFASPDHNSFCLVTSRAPLMDLESFTTYRHRNVDRLSPTDGRDMLRNLGVKGDEEKLIGLVETWDGHALTLSLLASYLVDHHQGDINQINNMPPPTANESRYERLHRVLIRYDKHLISSERAFLILFSAFRLPVDRIAFDMVFRPLWNELHKFTDKSVQKECQAINAPITALNDYEFEYMVKRLVSYRLLRYDPDLGQYTIHPLIRAHYFALLDNSNHYLKREAHIQIKLYYLAIAGRKSNNPTLEILKPFIEAAYHACRSENYDEANSIVWEFVSQGDRFWLTNGLAAYQTGLALMREFFPSSDYTQEPLVSSEKDKSWVLNAIGFVLINLGKLKEARSVIERANYISLNIAEDYHWASVGYKNLSALYVLLGELDRSAEAANRALNLSYISKNKYDERDSISSYAWAIHLRGDLIEASKAFEKAKALDEEIGNLSLYSLRATRHADHLRRMGDSIYSRKIIKSNLKLSEEHQWLASISRSYRILAELEAQDGTGESARMYFNTALRLAQNLSRKDILIEALIAKGRWEARRTWDVSAGFSDLNEALGYAIAGGYRLYEADIRVGLSWAHLVAGNKEAAKKEGSYAKQMCEDMGYYWGKKDADEVHSEING